PFLSSGGSSLLVSMVAAGLLLSVSRRPAPWRISDQRAAREPGASRRRGPRARRPSPGRRPAAARPNIRVPASVASPSA
ncbi:MAG: hypothetical protein KC636_39460, partial [Myxococcales bacterium]|nr:hypothetical protein [Myxococcales bacterium]